MLPQDLFITTLTPGFFNMSFYFFNSTEYQSSPSSETSPPQQQQQQQTQLSVWKVEESSVDGCTFLCPQLQSFNTSLPHQVRKPDRLMSTIVFCYYYYFLFDECYCNCSCNCFFYSHHMALTGLDFRTPNSYSTSSTKLRS